MLIINRKFRGISAMTKTRRMASICAVLSFCAGCSGLLPSSKLDTRTIWTSYDEAKTSFDAIIPYHHQSGWLVSRSTTTACADP
jgi:hypothetical protein